MYLEAKWIHNQISTMYIKKTWQIQSYDRFIDSYEP